MTNGHLYGLSENNLTVLSDGQRMHHRAAKALRQLQAAALRDNIHVCVASGFRSFERQLGIWNRKYQSDALSNLSPAEKLEHIMRWSALPGTSRHHWGTDCDLFDVLSLGEKRLQLEPWEYEQGGPFATLFLWLTDHAHQFGFYRPYRNDLGGVSPEPWHWSYAPLAEEYQQRFCAAELAEVIESADLLGKTEVMPQLQTIVQRYVQNVDSFAHSSNKN